MAKLTRLSVRSPKSVRNVLPTYSSSLASSGRTLPGLTWNQRIESRPGKRHTSAALRRAQEDVVLLAQFGDEEAPLPCGAMASARKRLKVQHA